MSRRPARFTEADLNRAGKVAKRLGLAVKVDTEGAIWLLSVESVDEAKKEVVPTFEFDL